MLCVIIFLSQNLKEKAKKRGEQTLAYVVQVSTGHILGNSPDILECRLLFGIEKVASFFY